METKSLADLYRQQNGIVETQNEQVQTGPSETDEALIKARLEQQSHQSYGNDKNVEFIADSNIKGVVIEKPQETESKGFYVGGIPAESSSNLDETLKQLDAEIAAAKEAADQKREEIEAKAKEEAEAAEIQSALDEEEYNKAVVIIDKLGMGLANFTPEERAKMEVVSKIEVQEIETLSLETLKIKKTPNKSIDKVLRAKKNVGGTSNIVAIASGYTAVMGKCSLFELSNLFIDKENIVETQLSKWSFIYSKIVSSSVKFNSFDDFIKRTALMDYNSFIFGILAASYPDTDSVGMKCANDTCTGRIIRNVAGKEVRNKDYDYSYNVRSLIRPERMSPALIEKFANIVDNSYVEENAIKVHESSPVMSVKRYRLPHSGYIIDAGVESVHDFIYNASRAADSLEDDKYRSTLATSTLVRKLYIPDDDGSYYEFEDKLDIAKAIYELPNNADIRAIIKVNGELSQDLSMEFGFVDITCPYCGDVTDFVPVNPDDILFHKYRQETATIE